MRQELIWRGVQVIEELEREMGFEPTTSSLGIRTLLDLNHLRDARPGRLSYRSRTEQARLPVRLPLRWQTQPTDVTRDSL
jgi:hypothetical protein